MASFSEQTNPQDAELNAQIAQKQQKYQRLIRFFYVLFAICAVVFVGGLYWQNVMAIAGGFVAAMMFGMAYLGVVITRDDEISALKDRLNSH